MKTILFLLLFLPFIVKAQSKDTVKIVMLVSDTSMLRVRVDCTEKDKGMADSIKHYCYDLIYDTRPFKMDGYQTSSGELLDAYKRKLSKSIIMWIAYKKN